MALKFFSFQSWKQKSNLNLENNKVFCGYLMCLCLDHDYVIEVQISVLLNIMWERKMFWHCRQILLQVEYSDIIFHGFLQAGIWQYKAGQSRFTVVESMKQRVYSGITIY